jgi:hypothetical protein
MHVEPWPRPDRPPGSFSDVPLKVGVQRRLASLGAVYVRVAEHLPAHPLSGLVAVVSQYCVSRPGGGSLAAL